MAVHSKKNPLELLQELQESFNRMSVALELIGKRIRTLQKSSTDYELEFDNDGTFRGGRSLLNPEKFFPKEHDFCIYITSACEELPKSAERLRDAYWIADEAIRSLPQEVFALLDRHIDRPWLPMVLQECLDLILVWPGEVLNTMGSPNVSSRVQILLTNAEHCSPFDTWGYYIERLAVYRSHIMAIRNCVAEPPAGGDAEAPEADTIAVESIEQLERDTPKPFEVDESLLQIRIDGKSHNVSLEAARMAKLLLDADGEWVSMARNDFTKPSVTKQTLPSPVQNLIETATGKGYRIKENP